MRFRGAFIFLALALLFLGAKGALAVGPFSHMIFARQLWPQAAPCLGLDPGDAGLMPALYAGALAPDAGYYPGAESSISTLVHVVEPWAFCRALLELAQTPQEKAFALGWASHAFLDLRTHGQLVNRLAGGVYNDDRLKHKQIEWGLECRQLEKPENAWLWQAATDTQAGWSLWSKSMQKTYGLKVDPRFLGQGQASQQKEVTRLPYVWWWSGRLAEPNGGLVNSLGWLLGETLRPAYVAWLTWRDQDMDVRAVLSPRPASDADMADLKAIMDATQARLVAALQGGAWPSGGLDADPACQDARCPEGRAALQWLLEHGGGGGRPAIMDK